MKPSGYILCGLALLLWCALASRPVLAGAKFVEGEQFLLVVGTDTFPRMKEFRSLKYAQADAASFASTLSGVGYEVVSLLGEQASRRDLVRSLYRLSSEVQEFDTLVVYCSLPVLQRGTRNFLITYDGSSEEPDVDAIGLEQFLDLLADIPARRKLIIFDANFQIRSGVTNANAPENVLRERLRGNTSVIAVPIAYELDRLKHGALMFTLLQGITEGKADINRDGEVGVMELSDYVNADLPKVMPGQQVLTYQSYESPEAERNWSVTRVGGSATDIVEAAVARLKDWHAKNHLSVSAYLRTVTLLRQSTGGSLGDDQEKLAEQVIRFIGTNPDPEVGGRVLDEYLVDPRLDPSSSKRR